MKRWWTGGLGKRLMMRGFLRRKGVASLPAGAMAASSSADPAVVPRGYSPKNVGNDASARPWESLAEAPAPAAAVRPTPEGFDADGFLKTSKSNFVNLQQAWDRADIASLRAMMTDGMLAEIQVQLAERERAASEPNRTEVIMLEAQLLGLEEMEEAYLASVEFSGLIREDLSSGPNPFREIWNITRPKSGDSGWLVAGVQALQ
jgi:predicted lipid-binding transport protein (Tim44 family)